MKAAIFRGAGALVLALSTLLVAGQTLVGLDDCYSRLEVQAHVPGCCAHDDVPTVEDVQRSCCRTPYVAELGASSTTTSTPDVAGAELVIIGALFSSGRPSLGPDPRGFRPVIERPPDRSPPTATTILLI